MKTQTVYIEIPASERLPQETGWYSCIYLTDLKHWFWFEEGRFYNKGKYENSIISWLEKKEDQIVMSKIQLDELKKEIADKAFDAGMERKEHEVAEYKDGFNWMLAEKTIPNKQLYLINLIK